MREHENLEAAAMHSEAVRVAAVAAIRRATKCLRHRAERIAALESQLTESREREGRMREALPRIAATLRKGGASLPAPDNDGTIDSAIRTGMSIALCVVEDEISALAAEQEKK